MRGFTEAYPALDPVLLHAMSWATELGVAPVGPGTGAALRLLAGVARAKNVVEIGTGTGVSGLWLLRGMRPDGVLTSIDIEPDHQVMARQCFAAAGFAPGRARLIAGHSRDVLPRLADDAYDLVFIDLDIEDCPSSVRSAHRLLRDGGLLALNNAFGVDAEGNGPASTDADRQVLRELIAYVRDAPEWTPAMLTVGTGLLCATKTANPPSA